MNQSYREASIRIDELAQSAAAELGLDDLSQRIHFDVVIERKKLLQDTLPENASGDTQNRGLKM